jgi:hypothetical protein
MGYSGARGTLNYEKNLMLKISCQTPFNNCPGSVSGLQYLQNRIHNLAETGRIETWCGVRIMHAVGNALVITSSFTYMACEFPTAVAKVRYLYLYLFSLPMC